jgi:type I site-specific restriction endonuclease
MDKYQLSERDICTKFIMPAIQQAGWQQHQFREEVSLTDGRVMVRGKLAARIQNPDAKGGPKRADYVLYARPGVPIAVLEAKQAKFSVGQGMQQALVYAEMLDAPFAISSNGDGFLIHDLVGTTDAAYREKVDAQIADLRAQAEPLRLQARDAQAAGDRIYWPIFNLDIKNPKAPEEETHDPDVLLKQYKKLLGDIEETENQLKSELAAALAHHFSPEADA